MRSLKDIECDRAVKNAGHENLTKADNEFENEAYLRICTERA